jgi:hypothetical protein
MSVRDHALTDHAARTVDRLRLPRGLSTAVDLGSRFVRALAFWVATLLPLTYLPLLAAGVTAERPFGFAALLCANAAAFVVGHTYKRHDTDENAVR